MIKSKRFTLGEEVANAVSHGLGAVLAIAGMVLLVVFAAKYGTARHVISFSVFGATLTILYLSSTLNHALAYGKAKEFFHNFDQIAIYLLIAGTYTPLALVVLKDDWGWAMFGVQWGLALTGIIIKLFSPNKFEKGVKAFFIISYIIMGWMLLFFLHPLYRNMPEAGMYLVFSGGLFYTIGTIFFNLKKMPYSHLVWHIFVLCGSVLHWISIFHYVLRINA